MSWRVNCESSVLPLPDGDASLPTLWDPGACRNHLVRHRPEHATPSCYGSPRAEDGETPIRSSPRGRWRVRTADARSPEETLVAVLSRELGSAGQVGDPSAEALAGRREQRAPNPRRLCTTTAGSGHCTQVHRRSRRDGGRGGWGMEFVGAKLLPIRLRYAALPGRDTIAVTKQAPSVGMKPFGKDSAVLVLNA